VFLHGLREASAQQKQSANDELFHRFLLPRLSMNKLLNWDIETDRVFAGAEAFSVQHFSLLRRQFAISSSRLSLVVFLQSIILHANKGRLLLEKSNHNLRS
jgi:hypothetical protein